MSCWWNIRAVSFYKFKRPEGILYYLLFKLFTSPVFFRIYVSFTFLLLFWSVLACLLTLDKIECFMEKRMSAVKSEIFSKLRFCCPLRASINKLLYSSIIVFLEKSTLLPKKHKKDIKSLLSLSGNKRLQAIKKSQLLQNTALWKASFILSTLYSSFICLIVFSSNLLSLTNSSSKISAASVPRAFNREF